MSLNTKIFRTGILALLLVAPFFDLHAQEENPENNDPENQKEHVMISLGYMQPIPFGNTIVNDAYKLSGGFEHSIWVRPAWDIWVGAKFNLFFSDVEKKGLTGNYNRSNIFSIGPMIGYKFYFYENFGLLLGAGVGYVKYTNYDSHYQFYDDGTTLWSVTNLEYDLTDHFGLYFSGELRRDFLKTEVLAFDKHYFDINYLHLSLGIRVTI